MKCICGNKHPTNSSLFEIHDGIFNSTFEAIVAAWVESAYTNPNYTSEEIEHVKGDPMAWTGRNDIFGWEKKQVILRRLLKVKAR